MLAKIVVKWWSKWWSNDCQNDGIPPFALGKQSKMVVKMMVKMVVKIVEMLVLLVKPIGNGELNGG